jgi:amidase
VALGSDTGGSVRIPSACCGTAGLKTTYGRVPAAGVWPLAPSLDTVGPMAGTVDGLIIGMRLLEPGFTVAGAPARGPSGGCGPRATPKSRQRSTGR